MSKKNHLNPTRVLANTHQQLLEDHLYAVGLTAQHLIVTRYPELEQLGNAALFAGLWHDIGKLDPFFQNWVNDSISRSSFKDPEQGSHINYERPPRHHEISVALFELLSDPKAYDYLSDLITQGIYWHHAKPIRKKDAQLNTSREILSSLKKSIGVSRFNRLLEDAQAVMQTLYTRLGLHQNIGVIAHSAVRLDKPLPAFKYINSKFADFDELDIGIEHAAKVSILRTAVISADRLISSLGQGELASFISNGTLLDDVNKRMLFDGSRLSHAIERCISEFQTNGDPARNNSQFIAAKALAETKSVAVLDGPAGVGKTIIALQYARRTDVKKLLWICPRVQVCLGMYQELSDYLPDARIELLTGDFKVTKHQHVETDTEDHALFKGDVVITTIDQLVSTITTHRQCSGLMTFVDAHVVMDEFHEIIQIPGFNILLAELVKIKQLREHQANLLLVSATINPLFCEKVLQIQQKNFIHVDTFNQSNFHIEFNLYDEESDPSPLVVQSFRPDTFVITNSATDAQLGFIRHQKVENAILLHSKFNKRDKRVLFEKVFNSFKRGVRANYDVLRAGPIVQASLNISCTNMYTELCSPENWLQRLGRLNRFSEINDADYTTYVPLSPKPNKGVGYGLKQQFEFKRANSWYAWLSGRLDGHPVTLSFLYEQYCQFYRDPANQVLMLGELHGLLEAGALLLNANVLDPVSLPIKPNKQVGRLKASSLRGQSRYVQVAEVVVDEKGMYSPLNRYLSDVEDESSYYTMSVIDLEGYDDNNPLQFMVNKHKKVMAAKGIHVAKIRSAAQIIGLAVDPTKPIYASYTDDDLDTTQDRAHPLALYYVQAKKQPVGMMMVEKYLLKETV